MAKNNKKKGPKKARVSAAKSKPRVVRTPRAASGMARRARRRKGPGRKVLIMAALVAAGVVFFAESIGTLTSVQVPATVPVIGGVVFDAADLGAIAALAALWAGKVPAKYAVVVAAAGGGLAGRAAQRITVQRALGAP